MQRPLLITGSNGQLGQAVLAEAGRRAIPTDGRDIDRLDITDGTAVRAWIEAFSPRAVINCAADTAVDDCELREDQAYAVNATAVGHLAAACNSVDATLVQISTDYVFDGTGTRPYREDDPVAPAGAYGRTKLAGEREAAAARRHLILRTAWLYGHGGSHFVSAICRQLASGNRHLRVVADQHGCPTFCDDLATATLDLIDADAGGVFHTVNSGATTWFGFARKIVELVAADADVEPVTTDAFPRPAPRPAYSVLDISRFVRALGRPMPDWADALGRYLDASCES